ncbi:glycosyltransferase family 2 protein [Mastigocoleus testarum]|uniref:Glycosyltransferase n=1 Tax=Mastigocoleus testarum BC008 TaxID=371196 RepID=A0A0V7ZRR0_9CYAN|nr:glycosyltransferase family 2 protein [Mastigocoleus testarum]KST67074.1 glycosyltransferase [Mastigocoleus testarum BC008]
MISIYILTYNEELDIAACIESAMLSDDIIVVDSCSSDRTVEIANSYPVRVVKHQFESHGRQRTWMLNSVPPKYEWVYILEADERMTPELFAECKQVIQNSEVQNSEVQNSEVQNPEVQNFQCVGYYVAERVMFMGRWIRHSTQYPRYQLRLLKHGKVWFEDYGHTEREVCEGATGFLKETYPHYTCGKGLSRWIDKHNRYSSDEAQETLHQLHNGRINWQDLFFGHSEVERRRALKDLSLRLPARPLIRFFYMYFILGGCWDGRPGLAWCTLQAFYEYLIVLKTWELKHMSQPSLNSRLSLDGISKIDRILKNP